MGNEDSKQKEEKKKAHLEELPGELADKFHHWKILAKDALPEIEEKQMARIHAIYQREIGPALPEALEVVEGKKDFKLWSVPYKKPRRVPTDLDFEIKTWLSKLEQYDGEFIVQAQQILKDVCKFQKYKKTLHHTDGFYCDPENLFCEEVKIFALETLSKVQSDEHTRDMIFKRIRYLEDIICEDELFDKPHAGRELTIQMAIVSVRRSLKYSVIPAIDNALSQHDARKALDSLKKHLTMLISNAGEFLFHVFRKESKKNKGPDVATKLITYLLDSPQIHNAIPDTQSDIREKVMGGKASGIVNIDFLSMGADDEFSIGEEFVQKNGQRGKLVKLTDAMYDNLFVGPESGIDERFRENGFVAKAYIKAHAILLEIGDFYKVIEKAAICASQGGTLLIYGQANAQLNAMLETCDDLLGALRDSYHQLAQIADIRFEELVNLNEATISRSKWFAHFRNVPSLHAKINRQIRSIQDECQKIKAQANSMTLYDRFQKVKEDTNDFLGAADKFSKRTADILGLEYQTPAPPKTMKLPSEGMETVTTGQAADKLELSYLN